MDDFKEFIAHHKNTAAPHAIHLTSEQAQMTERVAEILDISFANTVMALVQIQCAEIGPGFYKYKPALLQFANRQKGTFVTKKVNLTGQQVEVLNVLADALGLSFKDTAATLIYLHFASVGHTASLMQATSKN